MTTRKKVLLTQAQVIEMMATTRPGDLEGQDAYIDGLIEDGEVEFIEVDDPATKH